MGQVFITDENDNSYRGQVTRARELRTSNCASKYWRASSAHSLISGQNFVTGACWVHNLILGEAPATATTIALHDTSMSASHLTAFGYDNTTPGATHVIAAFAFEPSAGALSGQLVNFPYTIPIDVYAASGLTLSIGLSGSVDAIGRIGAMRNISVTYSQ